MQGEAASANVDAAPVNPEDLAEITHEGGYTEQIFHMDNTAFYWKKVPCGTLTDGEEKSMSGFKTSKGRLILLLGAKAANDLKLKSVLPHHSPNPRTFMLNQRFPGPRGKESACQSRRHGFGLWSWRIPPASEQLSPCTATACVTAGPVFQSKGAATTDSPTPRSPCSAAREDTAMKRLRTQLEKSLSSDEDPALPKIKHVILKN